VGPFSTGSATLDVVLQVGIVIVMLLRVALLIRRYRGR
jgi:hypothetical protein